MRLKIILPLLALFALLFTVMPSVTAAPDVATKGVVGGPQEFLFELDAYAHTVTPLPFRKGKAAAVAAIAFNEYGEPVPIGVTITDFRGKVVAYDLDWSDAILAAFVPSSTRLFHVSISNPTDEAVAVFLWTS